MQYSKPPRDVCASDKTRGAVVAGNSTGRLKRPIQPMPEDIAARLRERGLETAYAARPAYQRNDYLGWISQAKREATREKRIAQMLDELKAGGEYMRMPYRGPRGGEQGKTATAYASPLECAQSM